MGKYKKYEKAGQSNSKSNENLPNDSNNNTNNHNSNNIDNNNKNDLYNTKKRNNQKLEENSLSTILWEIFDAAKYFFIMCKNFLIPTGIPFKIFVSFLILEILYQGITIYLIKSISHLLEEYFAIWNNFIHIYIYIISKVQMIYIFICEGLLIFRFIHLKIYLYKKFNWLLNILSFIIIIFNIFEIKELNYKVHRFYTKNLDNLASQNKIIKDYIINEYINLHINKNEDYQHYEICYELKTNINIIYNIKTQFPYIKWNYNTYTDTYTGCRNLISQNESLFEPNSNNYFFKCENKIDVNVAPDVCVSSKYRQKRFYSQIRMAIYEIIILILWNLYNSFSVRIIYKYYPNLNSDKQYYSEHDSYSRKYQSNKGQNPTVTFKDINDGELNNNENYEEEEEEEEEFEEEEEEEKEKNVKGVGIEKVFKMRKISKRKMKTYKKKKKKKYKEENDKNKNIYFDDDILNLEYYENKNDFQDDPNIDKEEEKDEKYFNDNYKALDENNNENFKLKLDKKKTEDSDEYDESDSSDYDDDDDIEKKIEEDAKEEEDLSYIEQIDILNSLKKKIFLNVEKFQLWRRFWKFLFGKYILKLKYKIRHIFMKIDKSINKKEN